MTYEASNITGSLESASLWQFYNLTQKRAEHLRKCVDVHSKDIYI